VTRLHRDRLTWLAYLQVGCYGYFLYGFGPTVSLLREEQHTSRTLAGLHGTALAAGALISALLVAPLVRRYGRRLVVWGGLVILCLGVLAYVGSDALGVTLTGALLGSLGGSFVLVPVAAMLSDHHRAAGASAISEANAVAAGIGLVAPLVVGLAVTTDLGWRAALLVVLPAVALLALVGGRVRFPEPQPEPDRHAGSRRLPARYWIGWGVVTAGIAVEFCMTLWAADILRTRFGLGDAAASAGVTTIVAGMCIGRVFGGRLALRLPVDRLLYLAIAVCGLGFAVFWVTMSATLALTGLLVSGLGISLFYPLGIARAIEASDGRPDLASARVGLGAGRTRVGGWTVSARCAGRSGRHSRCLPRRTRSAPRRGGRHPGRRAVRRDTGHGLNRRSVEDR
jgi:predicted MFS family arabinose efflux permease